MIIIPLPILRHYNLTLSNGKPYAQPEVLYSVYLGEYRYQSLLIQGCNSRMYSSFVYLVSLLCPRIPGRARLFISSVSPELPIACPFPTARTNDRLFSLTPGSQT